MDRAGWNYPSGDFRVSDADRDRALCELGEAFRVGRLTADEFAQRSGQALASRTGKELTGLLADLPAECPPRAPTATRERAAPSVAPRTAVAAALAAMCCSALAVGDAVAHGPSPRQREFAREMAARHGLSVPKFPPSPGFDWAGTITPAAIAVLLVVLIVCLRVRLTRTGRD